MKASSMVGMAYDKAKQQTSNFFSRGKDFLRSTTRSFFIVAAAFLQAQQRLGSLNQYFNY